MRNLWYIIILFSSLSLVSFDSSKDSLTKNAQKITMDADSIQQRYIEMLTELKERDKAKKGLTSKALSTMPIKKPEGTHFILKALPDSTIHFKLLHKDKP